MNDPKLILAPLEESSIDFLGNQRPALMLIVDGLRHMYVRPLTKELGIDR